ncbi:MAG TPA: limonene-1,2-epoxide hydrolase family protein [Mycobacterium sp.]|nr:limonene-1,2-epoxide hydrolase family protein [Mycobacterium sp.]
MTSDQVEGVVRAELDAWSSLDVDAIMAPFATDAVWQAAPTVTFTGRDEILSAVRDYLGRMKSAELKVVNLAVNGDKVFTERIDSFDYDGRKVAVTLMGIFEIANGKIAAWRDYYDMSGHY